MEKHSLTTLQEARKILGTTAKGIPDDAVMRLVAQVDILTDIVVAHVNDSKVQTSIDIWESRLHTND